MMQQFAQRVSYERLGSGLDVYVLRTDVHDVVMSTLLFGAGAHAHPLRPGTSVLLSALLPGGVSGASKTDVGELFEGLGASVEVSVGAEHMSASITCRKAVFPEVITMLFESLVRLRVTQRDVSEARVRLEGMLKAASEDTDTLASIALFQSLYAPGHPHYKHSIDAVRKDVAKTTLQDVRTLYRELMGTVGSSIVVTGDVSVAAVRSLVRDASATLGTVRAHASSAVHVDKVVTKRASRDHIVSVADRMNTDTLFALPLTLTRECDNFHALAAGVAVLGGGSTGRLYDVLRNRESLTYDARASCAGFEDGYPGYLSGRALLPAASYLQGRATLRRLIKTWIEDGISATELKRFKQEAIGKFAVSLASTAGQHAAVLGVVRVGKPLSYLDEYPERIQALRTRTVNTVIAEQCVYSRLVTAAAGSITRDGTPLA